MPAPGGIPGMGGMNPPSGEISEQVAKMMGSSQGGAGSRNSGGVGSLPGGGQMNSAQIAQSQKMLGQAGALPGTEASGGGAVPTSAGLAAQPREVDTIPEEMKRGFSDVFKGIKEFFSLNTWLGVNPNKLDPQQEAKAKQLHSRYQQLDQEQQMVARKMFEEKMQKKRIQEEQEQRKKQIEAEKNAQTVEMPSSPKKGAVGPGGGKTKKQNMLAKLKQDRTTLNNTQGE